MAQKSTYGYGSESKPLIFEERDADPSTFNQTFKIFELFFWVSRNLWEVLLCDASITWAFRKVNSKLDSRNADC